MVAILAAIPLLGLGAFALMRLSEKEYAAFALCIGFGYIVLKLVWHVGWKPKPLTVMFYPSYLQVGQQQYLYDDITSYGVDDHVESFGGVEYPVSTSFTIGHHIFVKHNGHQKPVTVGMKYSQAQEVMEAFTHLYENYQSRSH